MQKRIINILISLFVALIWSLPCFSQMKEFRSWDDVSRLVGNGAEFYGVLRGTEGAISLIPDGEKYWLYIRGVKFRPVHTVSLKPNVAVLGINDQGKPIAFSLHLSSSEKPYITFDTRRTENIFLPGDYGWEYYEPDILNGKPLIRMYTYDHYNGESSRPDPAKYYLVGDNNARSNSHASNTSTYKKQYTSNDFQGKMYSGSGNIAHIGYDLSIAFGYDGFCVCTSESGSDVGWSEQSVEGSYRIEGNTLYVKCSEGNWEFEIQQGGTKLFFDKSEGQGMPNYMTLECSTALGSDISENPHTPAIRKNRFGKKLVKSITEEWVDWKGERAYNLCHTYNFEYDAEGNLKSVSKTSEDKPHKFVEKLELVDNNFRFSVMQDGKPIKTHKRQYTWDKATNKRPTRINGCLITDFQQEDGFNHYFASIHYYTDTYALKMDCIGYDTFNEWIDNIKEDQFNGLWSARDMNPLNHLYLIPSSIFNGLGFKNGMHHYMSADSIMYMVDKYEMKEFANMNGNPVDRPRGELSDYSNPSKYGMEYSSQDNDTNINILMLTYTVSKNSFYQNIESITEWFPIQSKKLPSYKGRRGDRFDRKWDYKFDDEGNLVEIIVDDYTYGGKSTVTYTISYVSD